jgi:hypothetical protein
MTDTLDVVLVDSGSNAVDAHISQRCGDLTLQSTSPGGFSAVSATLDEPILSDFLLQYDTVAVYDRRSGDQVGGGRLVEPAKGVSDQGEVWQIAGDRRRPGAHAGRDGAAGVHRVAARRLVCVHEVVAVDTVDGRPLSGWRGRDAILLSVPGGTVASGVMATMHHDRLNDCAMTLGGFGYTRIAGQASANWQNESAVAGVSGCRRWRLWRRTTGRSAPSPLARSL